MKRSKLLLVVKEAQEMIDRSRILLEESDSETDDLIDGPLNSLLLVSVGAEFLTTAGISA